MKVNSMRRNESVTRRDYVYHYLYQNIIDLTLEPGCALSENEIALQLNVSRTPVREAMIQLAKADLVEIVPQIGTYVSLINPALVEESRFMRQTLEVEIIKQAAEKIDSNTLIELEKSLSMQRIVVKQGNFKEFFNYDDDFHEIIYRSLGRERTWQAIDQMNAQFKRVRILRLVATETSSWEDTLNDHEELYKALRNRDAALASKIMKAHLGKCVFHLDELKEKYLSYFKNE